VVTYFAASTTTTTTSTTITTKMSDVGRIKIEPWTKPEPADLKPVIKYDKLQILTALTDSRFYQGVHAV